MFTARIVYLLFLRSSLFFYCPFHSFQPFPIPIQLARRVQTSLWPFPFNACAHLTGSDSQRRVPWGRNGRGIRIGVGIQEEFTNIDKAAIRRFHQGGQACLKKAQTNYSQHFHHSALRCWKYSLDNLNVFRTRQKKTNTLLLVLLSLGLNFILRNGVPCRELSETLTWLFTILRNLSFKTIKCF